MSRYLNNIDKYEKLLNGTILGSPDVVEFIANIDTSLSQLSDYLVKPIWSVIKPIISLGIERQYNDFALFPRLSDLKKQTKSDIKRFNEAISPLSNLFNSYRNLDEDIKANKVDRERIQSVIKNDYNNKYRKDNNMKSNSKTKQKQEKAVKQASKYASVGTRNSGRNHPEWYLKDPTMVKELVGLNVSNRQNVLNELISKVKVNARDNTITETYYGVSSVCGLGLELTIPQTDTGDWNQGINMLYKNIRAANAGAINYSPGQLSSYVLNIRSIDAALSTMERAIRALNTPKFYDAESPQIYFVGMGLDYDTFAANAANLREKYNRLAAIRYRLMPLNVTLLDRTRWLFSNIFADSNDEKCQHYIFRVSKVPILINLSAPDTDGNLYKLNEYALTDTTDEYWNADYSGLPYDIFVTNIESAFRDFQNDSVMQIIAGDILKAYGEEALSRYPSVPQDGELIPVYDEHILTQIQNASLSPDGGMSIYWDLTSDFPTMSVGDTFVDENTASSVMNVAGIPYYNKLFVNPLFNSNFNSMDAGRTLSATRFMVSASVESVNENTGRINYDTYGTEIVDNAVIYVKNSSNNTKYKLSRYLMNRFTYNVDVNVNNDSISIDPSIQAWTWFRYFPLVHSVVRYTESGQEPIYYYNPPAFDFNNFGIAYKANLESYNAICTLSMLHKPYVFRKSKTEVITD